MLSIIDEMLIGLVWKLEVGVKWGGWGLTRGLRGESRAFWGINSQDKSHYRTAQERLHAKWPHGGCIMVCVCLCAHAQYISPGLFWQSYTNTDRQLYFLLISFQHK